MALQEAVRDVLSVNVSLCYKKGGGAEGGKKEGRTKKTKKERKGKSLQCERTQAAEKPCDRNVFLRKRALRRRSAAVAAQLTPSP